MAKYRKKPVVIEAMRFDGYNGLDICAFTGQSIPDTMFLNRKIRISTLEGTMEAAPGDYIIKGVKGEFYPCKPDIFAATYEAVDDK